MMEKCRGIFAEFKNGTCQCLNCATDPPECQTILCRNGGILSPNLDRICSCKLGFSGLCCETEFCYGNSSKLIEGRCVCSKRRSGTNCEHVLECLNGGHRTFDGTKCECSHLYRGEFCEEKLCVNGGKLHHDGFRDFPTLNLFSDLQSCDCPAGTFGEHCQLGCFNGGTYFNRSCMCRPEFSGSLCQELVCHNSGTSVFDGKASRCECSMWYQGPTCLVFSTSAMGLTVCAIFVVFLLLIYVVACRIIEKKRLREANVEANEEILLNEVDRSEPPEIAAPSQDDPNTSWASASFGTERLSTDTASASTLDNGPPKMILTPRMKKRLLEKDKTGA